MSRKATYTRSVFLAFGVVAICFLASSMYLSWRNLAIDGKTSELLSNSLPSLEHLDAVCDALRDVEVTSEAVPEMPPAERASAMGKLDASWKRLETALELYRETPDYAGEEALYYASVPPALDALRIADGKTRARLEAHDDPGARDIIDRETRPATRRAIIAVRRVMELNASHAYSEARSISDIKTSSDRLTIALNGGAFLIGILGALWVMRVFRAHSRLLDAHSALVEQRAADLEQFGRRVAHDLLSPLAALSFCLSAFKRPSEGDSKLKDALARAKACVVRAQGLVDGVFEFSRAGGKPKVGDDADVDMVVKESLAEVSMVDDGDRPEIVVAPFEPCSVACSPGVLGAILTNLLRNALKYMSDSAVKRITVRIVPGEAVVRIEVEDTGPGVPLGMESVIFEPYVRAQGVTQPGLGLGLATVKRFCLAHGGEVGVRSSPSLGAVFWFTLPRSASAPHRIAS